MTLSELVKALQTLNENPENEKLKVICATTCGGLDGIDTIQIKNADDLHYISNVGQYVVMYLS